MIIDCVLYNGEADLLRLRMDTLADMVDCHVVIEGAETFSGQLKTPSLLREAALISYLSRITYRVAPLLPEAPTPWAREAHQRNAILGALGDVPDEATVLIGDVDELPDPATLIARWAHIGGHGLILVAEQSHRAYDARNVREGLWRGTCVATAQTVRQLTPEGVRRRRMQALAVAGGWHFTYMGSVERLQAKVRGFSHQEYNTPATLQLLEARRRQGVDPFGRAEEIYHYEPDAALPAPLAANPAAYPMLWRDAS